VSIVLRPPQRENVALLKWCFPSYDISPFVYATVTGGMMKAKLQKFQNIKNHIFRLGRNFYFAWQQTE